MQILDVFQFSQAKETSSHEPLKLEKFPLFLENNTNDLGSKRTPKIPLKISKGYCKRGWHLLGDAEFKIGI